MSKNSKQIEEARREGMAYALAVAKKHGIEYLERDCKLRGATKLPLAINPETVQQCLNAIKEQTCDCVLAMSVLSFLDLYKDDTSYQTKRAQQFVDGFNNYTRRLVWDEYGWQEVLEEVYDRTGGKINLNIRLNDVNQKNEPLETADHHRKVGTA